MIKILKQQTATSYPVYYCETSTDLQKLSTFAPVGSIAYENGKQYILNSLREFAALEYSVNLNDIQLPPDVKETWETESLNGILQTIYSKIDDSNNQLLIETVGKGFDRDSTIISGMSKTAFMSKINAGEFVDIKVISKILGSGGSRTEYLWPLVFLVTPEGQDTYKISIKYSGDDLAYSSNILTLNGWVES